MCPKKSEGWCYRTLTCNPIIPLYSGEHHMKKVTHVPERLHIHEHTNVFHGQNKLLTK